MAFGRKGLDHSQIINEHSKVPGGKLRALVGMKHDAFGNTPQPDSVPQGVNGQEAVDFTSNPAGDDLSGIEVQDGADVMELSGHFYIGKVTNPYWTGGQQDARAEQRGQRDPVRFFQGRGNQHP